MIYDDREAALRESALASARGDLNRITRPEQDKVTGVQMGVVLVPVLPDASHVVARAEVYLKFLKGEQAP